MFLVFCQSSVNSRLCEHQNQRYVMYVQLVQAEKSCSTYITKILKCVKTKQSIYLDLFFFFCCLRSVKPDSYYGFEPCGLSLFSTWLWLQKQKTKTGPMAENKSFLSCCQNDFEREKFLRIFDLLQPTTSLIQSVRNTGAS